MEQFLESKQVILAVNLIKSSEDGSTEADSQNPATLSQKRLIKITKRLAEMEMETKFSEKRQETHYNCISFHFEGHHGGKEQI